MKTPREFEPPRIHSYIHCATCLEQEDEGSLAVGWTNDGLQVFCDTCHTNVINLDFEGRKLKAI